MAKKPSDRPLEIVYKPLADLIPYARNARTHSDAQVAKIAASMVEFGWTNPVLEDGKNGIIAGHGRILAAAKLWLAGNEIPRCPQGQVPTVELSHLTAAQKRAYILADNRLALDSGWDDDLLSVELMELSDLGFDLDLTGFDTAEVEDLLAGGGDGGDGGGAGGDPPKGSLADRFGIPPFSVLNAREGWWQDRKRAWLALGITSEVGRG